MNKLALAVAFALGASTAAFAQQSQRIPPPDPSPGASQAQPDVPRGNRVPVQPAPRQPETTFEAADKNGDGAISRAEASTVPGLDFSTADRDKNASIDKHEFQVAMAEGPPRG